MKTYCHLWTAICLSITLCIPTACSTDSLPDIPEEGTETPVESPDSYHDKTREKPYPKADNEIYVNPTPLIVPQAMKTGEKLQFCLSRQEDFSGTETILSTPKEWCMFNPHKTLKSGTWYWRFRSIGTTGTTGKTDQPWSETYSFEVKAETPKFLTPAFDTFVSNAPRAHPRLFCFLDNGIEQARRNVTSHPEYSQLISRARTALNTDYSLLPNPYDKAADIKVSIQHLYQAYHLTQQKTYADKMSEILTILLAHPISDAQLFATNFGSTDIAICFIETYDLLYADLTPDEKSKIEELLMRVSRFYFKMYSGMQENHIFDNHFWQHNMRVLFQAAFVLYDKSPYAEEALLMLEYYYELWTARAIGGEHISYCLGDASHAYSGISNDPQWVSAFADAGITQTPDNGFGTTPLTKYRRHLLLLHPNTVIIYDELEASEPVRWDWLLHSPTAFTIDANRHTLSTTHPSKGFTSVTQLFSESLNGISQTNEFVVPPLAVPSPLYPNQWHLTATFTPSARNRILAIIQLNASAKDISPIIRQGDSFQCGDWNIKAILDGTQPAELVITNRTHEAVFSYSPHNPMIEGSIYLRKYRSSSLLYDETNKRYGVTEQTDYVPASTRAVSQE